MDEALHKPKWQQSEEEININLYGKNFEGSQTPPHKNLSQAFLIPQDTSYKQMHKINQDAQRHSSKLWRMGAELLSVGPWEGAWGAALTAWGCMLPL